MKVRTRFFNLFFWIMDRYPIIPAPFIDTVNYILKVTV